MHTMEPLPTAETPNGEASKLPPMAIEAEVAESESFSVSPEDLRELAVIEEQIDDLRQEVQTLIDASNNAEDAKQVQRERPERKFLGIFRRKEEKIPGQLSSEQHKGIRSTLDEAEKHLSELKKQRNLLEEKTLDLEKLRERRKTRMSFEYFDALRESGRAVTEAEDRSLKMGKEYQDLLIDKAIEELKKKRNSN